jgi:hypothetical protein
MKKLIYFPFAIIASLIVACSSNTNLCTDPELNLALKKALMVDLKDWQKNATYAGIDDFEKKVYKTIEAMEVVKTSYIKGNERYLGNSNEETSSCRCSSIIRFKDHEQYKQRIKGPVAKVRAEEHELNSAYLRLETQMNYLDNNGFLFSYVVLKTQEKPIQVLRSYPFLLQTNIDHAGKLIFDYIDDHVN